MIVRSVPLTFCQRRSSAAGLQICPLIHLGIEGCCISADLSATNIHLNKGTSLSWPVSACRKTTFQDGRPLFMILLLPSTHASHARIPPDSADLSLHPSLGGLQHMTPNPCCRGWGERSRVKSLFARPSYVKASLDRLLLAPLCTACLSSKPAGGERCLPNSTTF